MWIHSAINVFMVLVGVLTVVYLYIRDRCLFWERKNVPFIKPHFFYGNFGDLLTKKTSMGNVISDLYSKFKGKRFGGVWESFKPKLFIVDPSLVREILVKDFGVWPDRGVIVNSDVDPLSDHLANLDGKKWKSVRTKLSPTFTSAKLKQMHYLLLECGDNLEKYLDDVATSGKPVEVREINARFTTDVIGSCAFGIEMNSLSDEDAQFRKMGKAFFETTLSKRIVDMLMFGFPWLYKSLKLSLTPREVTDFFLKITKETFQHRERNNVQRHDFMDLLRGLKNTGKSLGEDEVEFNDELLAAQAFFFFIAGFETSSTTLSFCLHELAANEGIQDRLREEVHRMKAANNGEISWDSLKNMNYLDMVIQETLRKHPIVPHVERTSVKPYRIPDSNVELPAGSTCIIPIHALHHDPDYFPDPEKFDPERFSDEAKSQRPAFAYIPFGGGPRVCIGMRFAEQQMKIALVKTLDSFKVSLCEKSQNPIRYEPGGRLNFPEIGIWLKISKTADPDVRSIP